VPHKTVRFALFFPIPLRSGAAVSGNTRPSRVLPFFRIFLLFFPILLKIDADHSPSKRGKCFRAASPVRNAVGGEEQRDEVQTPAIFFLDPRPPFLRADKS